MKKFFVFVLALSLFGLGGLTVTNADVQIDSGQVKSTAAIKFFVARYARTGAVGTNGGFSISKDSVVVWDSTSADGVTVNTTTTIGDGLVAGITLDEILGSSRDNTAATDDGYSNWGRVQTWGFHADVRAETAGGTTAGTILCSAVTAGDIGACDAVSGDVVAVALEAVTSNLVDVMVYRD